ncbi:MAG: prepilin-type N-terminal cleavage/methylation domain-containing protein [Thermoguttaceae bacterium]
MRATYPRRWGHPRRGGFTLIELLITITIIGILAGISFGALNAARRTARTSKTKSTIVKLDKIIMRRYEEYATRRVPISTARISRVQATRARLDALRDVIRMEMPERWNDITVFPVATDPVSGNPIKRPALTERYLAKYAANQPSAKFGPAECLYMIVATGSAEDREQFNESEIGDADGDGWLEFQGGWGRPIMFLRWAPEFTDLSDLQSREHHDPFDVHGADLTAYHLVPLIYSGGPDKKYDIELDDGYEYDGDPYASAAGTPTDDSNNPDGELNHYDNIHNHNIEQR